MEEQQHKLHERLKITLKKQWGYESFRPTQLDTMTAICNCHDILALMPTGGGKSLLYQLPALTMEGVCIVITPLIALMKDQVDRLRAMGVSAAAIHSGLSIRQIDITLDNAAWGDLKLLYVAPERVASSAFRERLRTMNVSILAVDEAHCISQWGYDFRPSYLRIAELRELIPNTPILALTASATQSVAEDIMHNLGMKNGRIIRSDFARPNLSLTVRKTDDKLEHLLRVVTNVAGCGIVYVRTRDQTEKIASWLVEKGIAAEAYHAGMLHTVRSSKQERWSKGESRVIIATNAFGMGIDKADVRFVIHYDICDSLEAYYQEVGRAGRDGRLSYGVLLVASDDSSRANRRFDTEFPPMESIKKCYEELFNYLQIGIGDGKYASFSFNIYEFSARARLYTGTTFNAIKILQQNGYMTLTDETDNPPRILFIVGRDDLYKVRIDREELDHVIRTILRLYVGLFGEHFVPIDEQEIAQSAGYTVDHVKELLKKLWELHIIKYIPSNRSPILMLNEERLPTKDVYISPESYRIRKQIAIERTESIYRYVENAEECRSAVLLRYFGQEDTPPCGVCDICLALKRNDTPKESEQRASEAMVAEITTLLAKAPLTVKQIVARIKSEPGIVIAAIDKMLEDGTIHAESGGKIEIKKVTL